MANQAFIPFDLPATRATARAAAATAERASLAAAELHRPMRIVSLALEDEMRGWLRAVGIEEGEQVTLLRRAAFGGPIHVRTSAGGEFALHRSLAKAIFVGEDTESAA